MFLIFIACTIIGTACLPLIIMGISRKQTGKHLGSYSWLPLLAAALFLVSYYIPTIHISNETDTFQQHFVGGGMYTACLFIYFQKLLRWNASFLVGLAGLFAWVSALGVANELFEFALVKLNITNIDIRDTSWDLFANTCGALAGYILFLSIKKLVKKPTGKRSRIQR